jgi:sigma-B regulation protein RsbU (phosphoserine phosphatase)
MGLRMATDRDFKIVRTMEKLNHIIHRSRLTTKFVSLFYGELETGGILIYCNAGHNYPVRAEGQSRIELLKNGGPVLGPTPDATYTRGFAKLDPGDCSASTPTASSRRTTQDREFGLERLQRIVKAEPQRSAQEIGGSAGARGEVGSGPEDDRTVVIVKAVTPS